MCMGSQQTTPGFTGSLYQPTQTFGPSNISGPRPWTSVPFMQTYGGQGAPYADLSHQQLDAWNQGQEGTGRFGANAAARYGFAPHQPRPDTLQPGQAYYNGGMNPGAAAGRTMGTGLGSSMPQGDMRGPWPGLTGEPAKVPMEADRMRGPWPGLRGDGQRTGLLAPNPVQPQAQPQADPMSGFRQLLAEDPRAAAEALNFNPAWFQKNQGAIGQMVPGGDLGAWRNSIQPQSSNVGAITDQQRQLIRQRMGW